MSTGEPGDKRTESRDGFILQPTYRIENGRPVVLLYGTLEGGEPFLIRDDRMVPHFSIRAGDAAAAAGLGARVVRETEPHRSMDGRVLARVEVPTPPDTPAVRDRLQAAGIPCYEADVRFATRYLIDRGIRSSVRISGSSRAAKGLPRRFENPEVATSDYRPALRALSLDIETDPRARRLLSIALVGCGASEVLLFTPPGFDAPETATPFGTEKALLAAFVQRVRDLDPDVLTGWNVVEFDLTVLARIAERLRVPLTLGRDGGAVRFRASRFSGAPTQVTVPGRVVLDGIQLLRGAFVRLESYALDEAARVILGRGKTFTDHEGGAAVLRAFQEDRERLVEYNRNDAALVLEILDVLKLLELTVERSLLTGMPPDRVSASIAAFDFLYLSELSRRRIAAPTVTGAVSADIVAAGGHVLEPKPGLYRNVVVLDFKSLYPSVIRTFQIDPLGYLPDPEGDPDPIVAPNGAAFRRDPGILPGLLDDLFPRREAAKRAGDEVASQAIKILMNSFYGVLGTSACRFARPELANAITGFGRNILLWSKDWIEARGLEVLYGDTDSLFVDLAGPGPEEALATARDLVEKLNRDLAAYVKETWRVQSRLELELDVLYLRLLLPPVRHGTAGARKRYAGLVREGETERVVFTGLEAVRRDWTGLARTAQRELYARLFADRPVDRYLLDLVRDLRGGRLDERLVYRKALRKPVEAYTASTPPHVAAARRTGARPGSVVAYVITTSGPEPAEDHRSPIDYEHYVQKQLRPVAEPVLAILGLGFDRVVGDDRQESLF